MAVSLYKEQSPSSQGGNPTTGFRNFMDWLTGASRGELDSGATTGPTGVKVVEAYDGVVRETGTAGLSTLGATNLWRTGLLTATSGPWIVIEFPGTVGVPGGPIPFQIYFRINAANYRVSYQLIPNADWATGGGVTANPTEPATIVPTTRVNSNHYPSSSPVAFTTFYGFCDPGVFCMFQDTGSSGTGTVYYMGELDDMHSAETLPFVMYSNVDYYNEAYWDRLSPVNGTTKLTITNSLTQGLTPFFDSFIWTDNDVYTDLDGSWLTTPIFPAWNTSGHQHIAGKCRYLKMVNTQTAFRTTSTSRDRIIFNGLTSRRGGYSLPWDSTTPFPG